MRSISGNWQEKKTFFIFLLIDSVAEFIGFSRWIGTRMYSQVFTSAVMLWVGVLFFFPNLKYEIYPSDKLVNFGTHEQKCLPGKLKKVLNLVVEKFGEVTVTSTLRTKDENDKLEGAAPYSYHLTCEAVDFIVKGKSDSVVELLMSQSEVGGYKYYASSHYHIDTGPRRTW